MIAHIDTLGSSSSPPSTVSQKLNESSKSTLPPKSDPVPFICRRPVRITVYAGLVAFFIGMFAWGLVPPLLDPTFEKHIQEKKVMVGMSREQVLEAWGSPYQMNVSYTSKGIRREEWIFEDWIDTGTVSHRYLYFEEGKLVGGWQ